MNNLTRTLVCFGLLLFAATAHPSPSQDGQWAQLQTLPWRPVHSVLLPTGKVLFYSGQNTVRLWDPSNGSLSSGPSFAHNAFCSGHVHGADGRIFISGGTQGNLNNVGARDATYYDPVTNSLSPVSSMRAGRFYPSMVLLANGDIVTMAGDDVYNPNLIPEVWDVSTQTWRNLSNASLALPLYPAAFLAPNGKVFVATNPSRYLDTNGAGQWTTVASHIAGARDEYGSACMFDDGKVLYTGGGFPPLASAEMIDLNAASPSWSYIAAMPQPRRQHNTTLLPDGRVLVTGGSSQNGFNVEDGPKPAIVWDPEANTWTTWATEDQYRGYHSESVLLPDARVASIGGDGHSNLQVFSPPYLFNGPRPTITSAPAAVTYGAPFFVATPDAASIVATGGQVNWLRPSAVTHTKNMNQRINRLSFTEVPGGLEVTPPADANLAPPGDYMLFLINSNGVPSVAAWTRLLIETPVDGLVERWLFEVDGRSGSLANDATLANGASITTDADKGQVLSCDGANDYAQVSNTTGQSFSWAAWIRTSQHSSDGSVAWQGDALISSIVPGTANDFVVSILNDRLAFYAGDTGQSVTGSERLDDDEWHHIAVTADGSGVSLFVDGTLDASSGTGVTRALNSNSSVYFCGNPAAGNFFAGSMDHVQQYDRALSRQEVLQLATIGSGTDPLTVNAIVSPPAEVNTQIDYRANASGGSNRMHHWDFGDGTTAGPSSSKSVDHEYASPGVYPVTLTVSSSTSETVVEQFFQAVYLPHKQFRPTRSSSIVYEERGGDDRVWNVNPDNDTVSVFNVVTHAKIAEIPVGEEPRALAIAPNGRVWVTNKHAATITIINQNTLGVAQTIALPAESEPHGLVFNPAGTAAYVVLEALGELRKLNPGNASLLGSVEIGPDVRHLSVSWNGNRIFVPRFVTPTLPGEATATVLTEDSGQLLGGEVLVINAATMAVANTVTLQHSEAMDGAGHDHGANGHASARGIPNYLGAPALSPDGKTAWVPSKQDNIKRGMLRDGLHLTHDTSFRAITSRIELGNVPGAEAEDYPARVDHDNSAMPSAAAFGYYGNYLFVALEGSRVIRVISAYNNVEIAGFSVGRAPQGLALSPDGMTLYTHNFMDRSISVHDVSGIVNENAPEANLVATYSTVANEALAPDVLLGKQIFYDAEDPRLSFESYISCAGCHSDGAEDGRIWDFTGFGEGLRNTTDLRGKANQGPLHWTGNFDEVQDFEGQLRSLGQGLGLLTEQQFNMEGVADSLGTPKAGLSAELDALAAYVNSLTEAPPSPYRNGDGSLTPMGVLGRDVFLANGCAGCHVPNTFTDSALDQFHAIEPIRPSSGSRLGQTLTGFDTPSLNGVWASAPYLHDGSAATLQAAVAAHEYVTLGSEDTERLVAYLQQIDGTDDIPPTDPVDLSITAVTTSRIDLEWTGSTDASPPVAYYVYDNPGAAAIAAAQGQTSYSVPNLVPGTSYTFWVRAEDAFGNLSGPSNSVNAVTIADDDRDGMSDAFENANGLDWQDPDDADDDPDGDGLTNLQEYEKNPNLNPHSPDTDGDGIGDIYDDNPLDFSNACTGGSVENAVVAEVVNGNLTCAARVSIDVMSPTVVTDFGQLNLISPEIILESGFHGGGLRVMSADPCPSCEGLLPPEVIDTTPADSGADIATDSDIAITFSKPVTVTGDWFTIFCASSGTYSPTGSAGAHPVAVTDTDPLFALNPSSDFDRGEECTVTVFAANVSDDDAIDPPDNLAADFIFSFATQPRLDFGDAPDPDYATLLANDGARHVVGGSLFLGDIVDDEVDGHASIDASGDDVAGPKPDDEDGVTFTSSLIPAVSASVDIVASEAGGSLNAWVDFNADGDWGDSGEQIFADETLSASINSLNFSIPPDAVIGDTFARFRLSSVGGLSPTGQALDGEVEDYLVRIVANEDPTDITLSNSSVDENEPIGTVVGSFSSTDADSSVFTYSLVGGDGDTDNTSFAIVGDELQTAAIFDYKLQSSFSIRVQSDDGNGGMLEKNFLVDVNNVNENPTDIALDNSSVIENEPIGTAVGTFTSTDADSSTFTYSLVAGTGDTDNALFAIVGDQLQSGASFDAETQGTLNIRVQTEDGAGGSFEKMFAITVTDVNESPTDIALDNSSVNENEAIGTPVGSFTSSDPDSSTFTYSLVAGTGDTNNASFTIVGDQLQTAAVFDFETQSSYSFRVKSDDGSGGTFEEALTITVTDVNEGPTDIALDNSSVNENVAIGTAVGTFTSTDVDSSAFTYSLVTGASDTDNPSFTIVGDQLQTAAVFDFETQSSFNIRVLSDDTAGGSFEKTFTITVTDVNENPTDIALSSTSINENEPAGTIVGNFTSTDADSSGFTYSLVTGTGDTDNPSFTIVGDQLQTAAVFDFETQSSYSIRVRSDDSSSGTFDEAFTITVIDINDAPTDITLDNSSVNENAAIGTAVGNFTSTDADSSGFTYSLVGGDGDTDNASFSISGDQLQTAEVFDFGSQSSFSIRVQTDDNAGRTFEEFFLIDVIPD